MLNSSFSKKDLLRHILCGISIFIVFIVICAFVIPLVFSILPLFSQDDIDSSSFGNLGVSKIVFVKYIFNALKFTVKQAFFSTLVALLIGIPMGFFVSQRKFFGKKFFVALSAVPFCVPTLLVALAYVQFFGMNGTLNNFLKSVFGLKSSPVTFLYSFVGIVIAQGFYNFPLVMKTCSDVWSRIDVRQENIAILLGANSIKRFFSVTIHQISTAITTSAISVFLYCFFSFIIVLLFGAIGCTTIEVEIYQAVKNTLNFSLASTLSIIETISALILCFVVLLIEKKSRANKSLSNPCICVKLKSVGEKIFLSILVSLIIFFFVFPFLSLIFSAFNKVNFVLSNKNLYIAIKDSVLTALCTASFSVISALTCALFFRLNKKFQNGIFVRLVPLVPMAVSSVIIGYGLIIFLQILGIESNFFMLSIFQTVLAFPFAFRLISNSLDKINFQIDDVCQIFSSDKTKSVFWVYIPNVKESIYSAFAFSFAISCGDTSLPLILSIQNYNPLSLYTFRLASSYQFEASCLCGIILMIVGSSFFILKSLYDFVSNKMENL